MAANLETVVIGRALGMLATFGMQQIGKYVGRFAYDVYREASGPAMVAGAKAELPAFDDLTTREQMVWTLAGGRVLDRYKDQAR